MHFGVAEMTLSGSAVYMKVHTTKHVRPLIVFIHTEDAISCSACHGRLEGEAKEQMYRISILCSTGCCSVNDSTLIKCSADFHLHLLLIKINEALKQVQAFGVFLWNPSIVLEVVDALI